MESLWWLCFLFATGKAIAENDDSCAYHDTLFDIGLRKVLNSKQFEAIALSDVHERIGDLYKINLRLYNGALYYLRNLKRAARNWIRVTDAGIEVVFQVEGGPFRIRYTRGTVTSMLLDAEISVDVYFPHISMALYVREPSPTHLTLQSFALNNKRAEVNVYNEGKPSIRFSLARRWKDNDIKDKVSSELGSVLHKVVHQFLGMVELYAKNGTKVGEVKQPRSQPHYEGSWFVNILANRYRMEDFGPDMFVPVEWDNPSAWGIFDFSIKRLILNSGLDPLTLTDVFDITWNGRTYQIFNVTVDGLSNIRRGGENFVSAEECGLVARVVLFFENIRVQMYAKTYGVLGRLDAHIYGVNAVLEVREVNKTLQVVDYQLNFTMPVDTDKYILTPVIGPVVALFDRPARKRLTDDETTILEEASRRYIEAVVLKVQEFINDPAAYMPWDTSIIDAFRTYRTES